MGMGNFYSCGKSEHMKRDCPMMKSQARENAQVQESFPNPDAPKKNHFYALRSRDDQEESPNVVTGMLQVYSTNVYALLDHGATLCFVTTLVDMKFNMLPDVLIEHFSIITLVGESVVAKRVYRICPNIAQ